MRPFSAVPELLLRVRDAGLRIAIGSSAKKDELEQYLVIARITDLVDVKTSSEDAEESKPAPDIFQIVLRKLGMEGSAAVAIGDSPYDAEAAGKAKIACLAFYTGTNLPQAYRSGAFVGEHGSWNRPNLNGYKVAFVPSRMASRLAWRGMS